jgi:hypothetical protein
MRDIEKDLKNKATVRVRLTQSNIDLKDIKKLNSYITKITIKGDENEFEVLAESDSKAKEMVLEFVKDKIEQLKK